MKWSMFKNLCVALLMVLFTACGGGSKKENVDHAVIVSESTVQSVERHEVRVVAKEGAESYHWRQLSGISVEIGDPDSPTLSFTAPSVTQEERLLFELSATFGEVTQTAEVTVVVHPVVNEEDNSTEDNTTSGGNDDNATGGGEDNSTSGGNEDNTTGGGDETSTATLTSLTLTVDATSLNKDANTTLKVEAIYSDQTTKDVTDTVTWLIDNKDAVQIQSHTLTAKQDTNTTLRAKLGDKTSNAITLDLYWEVNGHRLPPEPDKTVNDATLLGVDINGNGVRDDVERWIYNKYKDKHPIHIDIAMQAAKGYRLVLETPEKAKEIESKIGAPIYCEGYYSTFARECGDKLLIKEQIINIKFEKKYFNTKLRNNTYIKFQNYLSGDSYTVPFMCDGKNYCDFNVSNNKE